MQKQLLRAVALAATAILPAQETLGPFYTVTVTGPVSDRQWQALARFDPLTCGRPPAGRPFAVRVQQHQLFQLAQLGLELSIDGGADATPPAPEYYTTAEVEQEIDALASAYPQLAVKIDLTTWPGAARTHDDNSIFALKVSDNAAADEDEPAILLAAQHHARELNTPHMVIRAMQRTLSGYGTDPALTQLVDGYEVYFVPTVNPDGVDHVWCCDNFWRKNRRNNGGGIYGVDLNRNFPFLWTSSCQGSNTTSSQTYRGPSAASEPETRTMRAAVQLLRPEIYLDFHSYGREVLALYPPCASVQTPIAQMGAHYADDLRAPMSYATRAPSASGEAPHDHWADGGTLSYLIEVGTAFQPAWSETVNEEARVWPGVYRALTTWQPSVRGHVRDAASGAPLAAEIHYSPDLYDEGELHRSRARDGRYALWIPENRNVQVTFSAPGYDDSTHALSIGPYGSTIPLEVSLDEATPATATVVFVQSIAVGTQKAGRRQKQARARVTVYDDLGAPVAGATVTGDFTGDVTANGASATTDANGVATVLSPAVSGKLRRFTFCVTGIAATLPYAPAQNAQTCSSR